MTASYHLVQGGLVVTGASGPVFIQSSDPRWTEAVTFIKNGDLQGLADWLTGKPEPDGFLRVGNEVVPADLKKQYDALRDAGLPTRPVLKFWERLQKNPNPNSRRQLYRFLKAHQIPITPSGLFIGYRGVTKGFKDKHTGTFDNSVGAVVSMPREQVNDDPEEGCSSGLHVANFRYAENFASGGHLVEVLVNPEHVVSVPRDSDFEKIRVCEFKVLRVITAENNSLIVSVDDDEMAFDARDVLDSSWDGAAPAKPKRKARSAAKVSKTRKTRTPAATPKPSPKKPGRPKKKQPAKRAKKAAAGRAKPVKTQTRKKNQAKGQTERQTQKDQEAWT